MLEHRSTELWVASAVIVVEILSPGDQSMKKFDHYASCEVREIWIVDPIGTTVRIYGRGLDDTTWNVFDRSDVLDVDVSTIESRLG